MNCLLIAHQLDFNGAPIALLALAKSLIRRGDCVALATLRDGPLSKDFWACGVKPFSRSQLGGLDLVVANTVATIPAALHLAKDPRKIIAWIHESAAFFEMEGTTPDAFELSRLAYAAFPSEFQVAELSRWMPSARTFVLRNCIDVSEIDCPDPSGAGYLVCPGFWEPRKGQETLIRLLASLEQHPPIHFLGANPAIGTAGKRFIFTGVLSPLMAIRHLAGGRGLVSCSLAETQNRVAIEAAQLGIPSLLSDIPAHRELKLLIPDLLLFTPSAPSSFAARFELLLAQWTDRPARNRLRHDACSIFGISAFDAALNALLGEMGLSE